jgi:hypothetical protein
MIEPSLSALLGCPEKSAVRFDEKRFSQITPPETISIFFDQLFKKLVLSWSPFLILVMILKEVVGLVLKQNPPFVWEEQLEEVPLALGLSNLAIYKILNFNVLRASIIEKCPDEHSQLVLKPVQLVFGYEAFFAPEVNGFVPCNNSRIDVFGHRLIDLVDFELFYVILRLEQGKGLRSDERTHAADEFKEYFS